MDGPWRTGLLTVVRPVAQIGLTVAEFSSYVVAIFGLLGVMVGGALYLLSYSETFA